MEALHGKPSTPLLADVERGPSGSTLATIGSSLHTIQTQDDNTENTKIQLSLLHEREMDLHLTPMSDFLAYDNPWLSGFFGTLARAPLDGYGGIIIQGWLVIAAVRSFCFAADPPHWATGLAAGFVGPKWGEHAAILVFSVVGINAVLAFLAVDCIRKFLKTQVTTSASRIVDQTMPQPLTRSPSDGYEFAVPVQRKTGGCFMCGSVEHAHGGDSALKSVQKLSGLELAKAFGFTVITILIFGVLVWRFSEGVPYVGLYMGVCVFPALWVMMDISAIITTTTFVTKSMVFSLIKELNETADAFTYWAREVGPSMVEQCCPGLGVGTRWSDLGWKLQRLAWSMHQLWDSISPLIVVATIVFLLTVAVATILSTAAMVNAHVEGSIFGGLAAAVSVVFYLKTVCPATETTDMCTTMTDDRHNSLLAACNIHMYLPWPVPAEVGRFSNQLQSSDLGARLPFLGQVSSAVVVRIGYLLCTMLVTYEVHLYVFLEKHSE